MKCSSPTLLLVTVGAAAVPALDAAQERLFAANVGHLVDARLDPLVNPGTCSGHVHSVFGNALFGADLSPEMLIDPAGDWRDVEGKYDATTSELIPNLSMYWAPSMYIVDPSGVHHIVPTFVRPYYRITLRGDGDTSRIHPFPPFLRMIVGDASRKTAWESGETDRDDIRWTLRTINRQSTNYLEHGDWTYLVDNPDLPNIDSVEMKLEFPECLAVDANGEPLTESSDWRSHMHYITGWDRFRLSYCPESHPYQIPKLDLEVRYLLDPMRAKFGDLLGGAQAGTDYVNDVSNWVLSSGDTSGAGGHADFVNGWPTELMANMIDHCTDGASRNGGECLLEQFAIDGREDKQVPYHGLVPLEQIDEISDLIVGTVADGVECDIGSAEPPSPAPLDCGSLDRRTCRRAAGCAWARPNCVSRDEATASALGVAEEVVAACDPFALEAGDLAGCEKLCLGRLCCFEAGEGSCLDDPAKACVEYAGCEPLLGDYR